MGIGKKDLIAWNKLREDQRAYEEQRGQQDYQAAMMRQAQQQQVRAMGQSVPSPYFSAGLLDATTSTTLHSLSSSGYYASIPEAGYLSAASLGPIVTVTTSPSIEWAPKYWSEEPYVPVQTTEHEVICGGRTYHLDADHRVVSVDDVL